MIRDLALYRHHIEAALAHAGNLHRYEDVARMVADGALQFWPGADSVILTEVVPYPTAKVLHFFLAGGTLPELEAMTPEILAWGRRYGCTRASLAGRRGWARSFLKDAGWRETLVVLETNL